MTRSVEIADAGHQLKAWVYFHGDLDSTSGSLTANENALIYKAFNVDSILFTETGTYEVNFPTGLLTDDNYLVLHCLDNSIGNNIQVGSGVGKYNVSLSSQKTTSKVVIHYRYQGNNTAYDVTQGYVAIFR